MPGVVFITPFNHYAYSRLISGKHSYRVSGKCYLTRPDVILSKEEEDKLKAEKIAKEIVENKLKDSLLKERLVKVNKYNEPFKQKIPQNIKSERELFWWYDINQCILHNKQKSSEYWINRKKKPFPFVSNFMGLLSDVLVSPADIISAIVAFQKKQIEENQDICNFFDFESKSKLIMVIGDLYVFYEYILIVKRLREGNSSFYEDSSNSIFIHVLQLPDLLKYCFPK
jgi:hypothetical protein